MNAIKRESNFELLRIVSIFLILLMHSYGMIEAGRLSTLNYNGERLVNAVGNTGVTLFVLLSGYFGIRFRAGRFRQIIYLTTLYALVVAGAGTMAGREATWWQALLVVVREDNWFITCYLLTMFLSTYLNVGTAHLSQRDFQRLLIGLFVAIQLLPSLTAANHTWMAGPYGKSLTNFLFIYLLGRYFRTFPLRPLSRWTYVVVVLGSTAGILATGALSPLHRNAVYFDNSPLILCSAVAIFHFFGTLRFRSGSVNFVSGSVLAMYLLDGLRPLLVPLFAAGTATHSLSYFPRMAGLTLATIATAFLIDRLRILLLGRAEKRVFGL